MNKHYFHGNIAAFFTVAVWGVTFISTKILLVYFSPQQILFIRFMLGWLTLWVLCPHILPIQDKTVEILFAAAGLTGVTLYFLFENIALEYSLATNVGIIVASAPFFTALADWLLFKGGSPGLSFYLGFAIAMSGICLMSLKGHMAQFNVTGDGLALLAAIVWAFYSIFTKKLSALGFGSLRTTRRIFFYGLLFMLPALPFWDWHGIKNNILQPVTSLNLFFLGVGASACCFATWTYCIKCLGAARASAYIYLVPVITFICAVFVLDEPVTCYAIIGIALVLAGLFLSEVKFEPGKIGFFRKRHESN